MRYFFPAIILFFSYSVTCAYAKLPWRDAAAEANRLIQTYLPPDSQHVFEAPDDSWETSVSYWRLDEGSKTPRPKGAILLVTNLAGANFFEVNNPSERDKKTLYREVSYFRRNMPKNKDQPEKTFAYYPDGTPFVDLDRASNRVYCREFFSNGILRDYTCWQDSHWLAGIAVDPTTKKPSFFSDGEGNFTTYAMDLSSHSHQTTWYHRGSIILVDKYTKDQRVEVDLDIVNDSLQITKEKEELILSSQSEIWTRAEGLVPTFQPIYDGKGGPFVLKNKDVRVLPPMMSPRDSQEAELKQIQDEWSIAYPKRRKVFLDQWEKNATDSGQTWKSLNIEFVRDHTPWPKD